MSKNNYIDIILQQAKSTNKTPAMAYMDLVFKDMKHSLQYSEAIEIIYSKNIIADSVYIK